MAGVAGISALERGHGGAARAPAGRQAAAGNSGRSAASTRSGASPFRHLKWPSGQTRWPHGLHGRSSRRITARELSGGVKSGRGRAVETNDRPPPARRATCIRPESLLTTAPAAAIRSIASDSVVRPARLTIRGPPSAGELGRRSPHHLARPAPSPRIPRRPGDAPTPRNAAGGQRLAGPYSAPTQSATAGRASARPNRARVAGGERIRIGRRAAAAAAPPGRWRPAPPLAGKTGRPCAAGPPRPAAGRRSARRSAPRRRSRCACARRRKTEPARTSTSAAARSPRRNARAGRDAKRDRAPSFRAPCGERIDQHVIDARQPARQRLQMRRRQDRDAALWPRRFQAQHQRTHHHRIAQPARPDDQQALARAGWCGPWRHGGRRWSVRQANASRRRASALASRRQIDQHCA